MKIICPKCDSEDVLVGNNKMQNKCEKCEHEWETCSHTKQPTESVFFKSPQILCTINKTLRQTKFSKKLDEAFSRI